MFSRGTVHNEPISPNFVIPANAGTQQALRVHREFQPTVYLLANRKNGAIYTGVTSNLIQRIHQHRESAFDGFTRRHAIKRLVWFEQHATMESAIVRERRIKKWLRRWTMELIERDNLGWRDLAEDLGFVRLEPTGSPAQLRC